MVHGGSPRLGVLLFLLQSPSQKLMSNRHRKENELRTGKARKQESKTESIHNELTGMCRQVEKRPRKLLNNSSVCVCEGECVFEGVYVSVCGCVCGCVWCEYVCMSVCVCFYLKMCVFLRVQGCMFVCEGVCVSLCVYLCV